MRAIPFLVLLAGIASAQAPQITELGPAASYLPNGVPAAGVAQGSFFYIKGRELGPVEGVLFSGPAAYTMGVDLAGTRVRITMGATVLDAFPYYVSAGQINVILPSNTPIGLGTVTVFRNGQQGVFPITVVRAAYGIFTLNSAGTGAAVVTHGINNSVITLANALHPGEPAVLWGTGLGAANFADNQPAQFLRLEAGVNLYIGGVPAAIQYAGRTPGLSGLDQINFVVPAGVSGCGVPIVVTIANRASNFATVPVTASGTTCSDPDGMTVADVAAAQTGPLAVGTITLRRRMIPTVVSSEPFVDKYDQADAQFARFQSSAIQQGALGGTISGCTVGFISTIVRQAFPGGEDPRWMDAGGSLNLTSPSKLFQMQRTASTGPYFYLGAGRAQPGQPGGTPSLGTPNGPFLDGGAYTVTGSGGSEAGAFTATTTVPSTFQWSNAPTFPSVSRALDLPISWTGAGSSDWVQIRGSSSTQAGLSAEFVCYVPASAGTYTIPAYVLSAMPASQPKETGEPGGYLFVGTYGPSERFQASGLNYGLMKYLVGYESALSFD